MFLLILQLTVNALIQGGILLSFVKLSEFIKFLDLYDELSSFAIHFF